VLNSQFLICLLQELFCNRPGREASGLRHLRRATERGHAAPAYMVGMLTLHHARSPPGGTERALERLDCSSAGAWTRRRAASVRREAVSVVRNAASVEDGRASHALLESSVVRQGGGGGGQGRPVKLRGPVQKVAKNINNINIDR
jgi:hypothetical protein